MLSLRIEQPPPDRPHRDKRRRPLPPAPAAPTPSGSSHSHQPAPFLMSQAQRIPSQPETSAPTPDYAMPNQRQYTHEYALLSQQAMPTYQHPPPVPIPPLPASPYGRPPRERRMNGDNLDSTMDFDYSRQRNPAPISRDGGATGEPLSAGPANTRGCEQRQENRLHTHR